MFGVVNYNKKVSRYSDAQYLIAERIKERERESTVGCGPIFGKDILLFFLYSPIVQTTKRWLQTLKNKREKKTHKIQQSFDISIEGVCVL